MLALLEALLERDWLLDVLAVRLSREDPAFALSLVAADERCLGFLALDDEPPLDADFDVRREEALPAADERPEPDDLALFERYVELFELMRLGASFPSGVYTRLPHNIRL